MGSPNSVATGFETVSVAGTSIGITASLLVPLTGPYAWKQAASIMISVETDQIRFVVTGGDPTSGHLISVGDVYEFTGYELAAGLRMIKVTNTSSVKVTVFHTKLT